MAIHDHAAPSPEPPALPLPDIVEFEAAIRTILASPPTVAWPGADGWYETLNGGRTHRCHRGVFPYPHSLAGVPLIAPLEEGCVVVVTPLCAPRVWWDTLDAYPRADVLPVFFHRGRLLIGPVFGPASPICPTCLWLRLAQGFPHPDVFSSLLQGPVVAQGLDALTGSLSKPEVAAWLQVNGRLLAGTTLYAFDLASGELRTSKHQVVPPPGYHPYHHVQPAFRALAGGEGRSWSGPAGTQPSLKGDVRYDDLLGPLIATVAADTEPDEPPAIAGMVTFAGHLGRFATWAPDVSGSGLNFDREAARWASIGEAVERYCGNFIPDGLLLASEQELARSGRFYLPLGDLQLWTAEQASSEGWPFAPADPATPLLWTEARVLSDPGTTRLLPAELVYLNLTRFTRQQARIPVTLAGIAAHQSRAAAERAALLELIERDATMLWWHGRVPGRNSVQPPASLLQKLTEGVPAEIEQWWLLLPSAAPGVAVVGGCLYDRRDQILVVGFAARGSLEEAVQKAAAEAWQLRRLARQLLDADSTLWQEIRRGRLPIPVVPFRPDRSYRQAFRSDFTDMHQLAYNLQYYLDPETLPQALAWLRGQEPIGFDEAAATTQTTNTVVDQLADQGIPVYGVDVTTADMGSQGFVVVRVACPGLVGNTATAFVPRAHPRLLQACLSSGRSLVAEPLPHA